MRYTIYKDLRLKVEIEADSAQEAYEQQLDLNDNEFAVLECDYSVFDAAHNNISEEVMM